jgi:putative transposase
MRDVDELLAQRGVIVGCEAIRLWINHFGRHFAQSIRRDGPRPNNKRHLDEGVISIRGKGHWLWRAIEADGDVLDTLIQTRRNAKAAKRFFRRLVTLSGRPTVVITPFRVIVCNALPGNGQIAQLDKACR